MLCALREHGHDGRCGCQRSPRSSSEGIRPCLLQYRIVEVLPAVEQSRVVAEAH